MSYNIMALTQLRKRLNRFYLPEAMQYGRERCFLQLYVVCSAVTPAKMGPNGEGEGSDCWE